MEMYNNHNLKGINIKMDYEEIPHEDYLEMFDKILEDFKDFFEEPIIYQDRNYNITSKVNKDEINVKLEPCAIFKKEDKIQLLFKNETILFDFNGVYYNNYEESLNPCLDKIITILNKYNINTLFSINLRYVNEINDYDNEKIIKDEYDNVKKENNLIQSINTKIYKENQVDIIVNFGLVNSNEDIFNFIIDIQGILDNKIEVSDLKENIVVIHKKIEYYFNEIISKEFKERMR